MAAWTAGIVNYNTRDLLRKCLHAVLANGPEEVIVVDNGSTDGSAEMVRAEFPGVRLDAGANTGFGAGSNRLLALCRTPRLLILNSDVVLHPDCLQHLSRELDAHSNAAVAAPGLYGDDGILQRSWRRFPGSFAWLLDNGLTRRFIGRAAPKTSRQAPWVFGAAMGARTAALREIGGFDEAFFMYCEDIDLCLRLRTAGWQVRYVPDARAVHVGGASTGQVHKAMARRLVASTEYFYRKHYSGFRLGLLLASLHLTLGARWLRDAVGARAAANPKRREILRETASCWKSCLNLLGRE